MQPAALSPTHLVTTRERLRSELAAVRSAGRTIGLVPTMGALHKGHVSLAEASRRECDFTVATVFVNPAQFGPRDDYQRYPRTLDADLAALAEVGVDLVFAPDVDEVYRPGHATHIEVRGPAEPLEGRFRPGHFRGVATVVLKLFNLIMPDRAYFGQKDYQQSLVIRRMVDDLDLPVEIRIGPIVREPDGLAMSSRNAYLTARQREQALLLNRSLRRAAELVAAGQRHAQVVLADVRSLFAAAPDVRLEYFVLADPETLQEVERIDRETLAAVAAWVGTTRLIDNLVIGHES
ncbi:MAG TPA: pantoate--beta-alanine ligase [Pirellulales bacterium]|nr:pantoate--beta-alanine ligase [Pirellulales bacterium]